MLYYNMETDLSNELQIALNTFSMYIFWHWKNWLYNERISPKMVFPWKHRLWRCMGSYRAWMESY